MRKIWVILSILTVVMFVVSCTVWNGITESMKGEKHEVVLLDDNGNRYAVEGTVDGKKIEIKDGRAYIYSDNIEGIHNVVLNTAVFEKEYTVEVKSNGDAIIVHLKKVDAPAVDIHYVNGSRQVIFANFDKVRGIEVHFNVSGSSYKGVHKDLGKGILAVSNRKTLGLLLDPRRSGISFEKWFTYPADDIWTSVSKVKVLTGENTLETIMGNTK